MVDPLLLTQMPSRCIGCWRAPANYWLIILVSCLQQYTDQKLPHSHSCSSPSPLRILAGSATARSMTALTGTDFHLCHTGPHRLRSGNTCCHCFKLSSSSPDSTNTSVLWIPSWSLNNTAWLNKSFNIPFPNKYWFQIGKWYKLVCFNLLNLLYSLFSSFF